VAAAKARSARERGSSCGDLPEAENEERAEDGEVGLEVPGGLATEELLRDSEGEDGAARIALGDRQPARGVGELAVGGKGRLAGEDDGSGEEREDAEGGGYRPRVGAAEAPRQRGGGADTGEENRQCRGERDAGAGERGELGDEDQGGEADGDDEGARQALAGKGVYEQAQAGAEGEQKKRVGDPCSAHDKITSCEGLSERLIDHGPSHPSATVEPHRQDQIVAVAANDVVPFPVLPLHCEALPGSSTPPVGAMSGRTEVRLRRPEHLENGESGSTKEQIAFAEADRLLSSRSVPEPLRHGLRIPLSLRETEVGTIDAPGRDDDLVLDLAAAPDHRPNEESEGQGCQAQLRRQPH